MHFSSSVTAEQKQTEKILSFASSVHILSVYFISSSYFSNDLIWELGRTLSPLGASCVAAV